MTIVYRDSIGTVSEEVHFYDDPDGNTVDFCDGYAYFTSEAGAENGEPNDRKIPIDAIVQICF